MDHLFGASVELEKFKCGRIASLCTPAEVGKTNSAVEIRG